MQLCVRERPLLDVPGPSAIEYDKKEHAVRVHCTRHIVAALPPRVAFLGAAVTDDHFFNAHVPPALRALVVYGQTGSGKTHTLERAMRRHVARALARGPLAIAAIEIYNEKVWDVLAPHTPRQLQLCDHDPEPCRTPPARTRIASVDAFDHQMRQIAHLRFQGASRLNTQSSRSHLIYRVHDKNTVTTFVDLAGNEKGRHSFCHREAAHINQSLFAFKECSPPRRAPPRALPPQPAHAHAAPLPGRGSRLFCRTLHPPRRAHRPVDTLKYVQAWPTSPPRRAPAAPARLPRRHAPAARTAKQVAPALRVRGAAPPAEEGGRGGGRSGSGSGPRARRGRSSTRRTCCAPR